jgi:hypothetical protein
MAGEACVTRAAGAVTGHDPDRMTTDLPIRRVAAYHRFGDETEVVDTAAGKARTTTTRYDLATRVTGTVITSDEGVAVPAVTTGWAGTLRAS